MKTLKDCKGKSIHITNKRNYNKLMIALDKANYKWISGKKPKEINGFEVYKENTIIHLCEGNYISYGDVYFTKQIGMEVIEFEEVQL